MYPDLLNSIFFFQRSIQVMCCVYSQNVLKIQWNNGGEYSKYNCVFIYLNFFFITIKNIIYTRHEEFNSIFSTNYK